MNHSYNFILLSPTMYCIHTHLGTWINLKHWIFVLAQNRFLLCQCSLTCWVSRVYLWLVINTGRCSYSLFKYFINIYVCMGNCFVSRRAVNKDMYIGDNDMIKCQRVGLGAALVWTPVCLHFVWQYIVYTSCILLLSHHGIFYYCLLQLHPNRIPFLPTIHWGVYHPAIPIVIKSLQYVDYHPLAETAAPACCASC